MFNFSIEEVSDIFLNADFTIRYVGQLCESDTDIEAIEETIYFKDLRWEEVTPELLRKRFTAFSFFTEIAFFLFIPSVIVASIRDPLNAHLAIDNILGTLPEPSSVYLKEFYQRRWRMFNSNQLTYLKKWIEFPEAPFREYFEPQDLREAATVLDRYACVALNLEKLSRK